MAIMPTEIIENLMKCVKVTDIIKEVKAEICEHYCKYTAELNEKGCPSEDLEDVLRTECIKCPLMRL